MKPGPIIYGPNGEQIADMRMEMLPQEEHLANVRLLKAARQLLAAAERGVMALEANGAPNCQAAKELRAAIEEAESGEF